MSFVESLKEGVEGGAAIKGSPFLDTPFEVWYVIVLMNLLAHGYLE